MIWDIFMEHGPIGTFCMTSGKRYGRGETFQDWFVKIFPPATSTRTSPPEVGGQSTILVNQHKHLGVIFSNQLDCLAHMMYLLSTGKRKAGLLRFMTRELLIWSAGAARSMLTVSDRFRSTRHQYGTEVFLVNGPLILRESKPVLHGEFRKHPWEHQSKCYLRDSNGHPVLEALCFYYMSSWMTRRFGRYHCYSGASWLKQVKGQKKAMRTSGLPAGHGAVRSGQTGRSPLRWSRILTQCEFSHEETLYESPQRSQPASFATLWASGGWSRLARRIPPNNASVAGYRRLSEIRAPLATSKLLLKNQWPSSNQEKQP